MDNLPFSLFVVMAALVLFSGCTTGGLPQQSYGGTATQETQQAQGQPVPATCEQDASAEPSAQESTDDSIVGQIERCEGKEICLMAVALEYESPAICEGLLYPTQKDCYKQLAVKYRNAGYCNELYGYERDDCLEAVPTSENQTTVINTYTTEANPSQTVSGNYSLPEQIEMCGDDEACLMALALDLEIPSLCGELPAYLEHDCYEQLAIRYNKPQYCELMASQTETNYCKRIFE